MVGIEFGNGDEPLRLIKVSTQTVAIVDVPRDGGVGVEYQPWAAHDPWEARLTWLGDRELRIDVGPYELTASAVDDGLFVLHGVETGPYGEHEFDVYGVTGDPGDLVPPVVREYVRVDAPVYEFRPDPEQPHAKFSGVRHQIAPGQASRGTLPAAAGADATALDDDMHFRGIQGGQDVTVRLTSFPTAERPDVQVRTSHDHLYRMPSPASFGGGRTSWFQLLPAPWG